MKLIKDILLCLLSLIMISCQSCDLTSSDSLLKHKYDVVMGILAPDSANSFTRSYQTEVFVGRMIPTDIDNIYNIEGVKDTALFELIFCTRQYYFNYYSFDESANVQISGNGQTITLTYVGHGIYRDVNNELHVMPNISYALNVEKSDGREFTASTKIPGNVHITSIASDTLYKYSAGGIDTVLTANFYADSNQYYYMFKNKLDNNFGEVMTYVFTDGVTPLVFFQQGSLDTTRDDTVNVTWEVRAISKEYGAFFQPCGGYSESNEFLKFEHQLEEMSIEERSNINGEKIVGVFGSYNSTIKKFVAIHLRGKSR
ncbi:hypothetical protein JNM05_03895 [bacterium]|nr:hypothetical protein [bacterium]